MKERKGLVLNVGISSMILIFLALVLSVFGLLSVRASVNEWKLAKKTGESVVEYYDADAKAEYTRCLMGAFVEETDLEKLEECLVGLQAGRYEGITDLENVKVQIKENSTYVENENGENKPLQIGTISYDIFIKEGSRLEVELELYNNRTLQIAKWKMVKDSNLVLELEEGTELWDGVVITE